MALLVRAMLRGLGVSQFRYAADGRVALERLKEKPADLIIVDFLMKPMDGVAFTRFVRTAPDSPGPYLPIIMVTGHSDRGRVLEARDAGVNEILVKPLTARALVERMDAIINRPRPFVRTPTYFGPDRRRQQDETYPGPFRRADDPAATRSKS